MRNAERYRTLSNWGTHYNNSCEYPCNGLEICRTAYCNHGDSISCVCDHAFRGGKMECLKQLKWAWQRLYRGWDDRVIWSIMDYLARLLPVWLERLKEEKHGVPGSLCPEGMDVEEASIVWDGILDEMIAGFAAASRILESDFPAWASHYLAEHERYGRCLSAGDAEDRERMRQVAEEIDFWPKLRQQEDEALEKFNVGMDLFKEYFFDLWD